MRDRLSLKVNNSALARRAEAAITIGELSNGPMVAADADENSRRQLRLQVIETLFAQARITALRLMPVIMR